MAANDREFWYINWRDPSQVEHIQLSQSEYNEKFQWYKDHGYLIDNRKGMGNRTVRSVWYHHPFSYCHDREPHIAKLYTTDGDYNFTVYYTYFDSSKQHRDLGVSGGAAFRLVNGRFFAETGKSLQAAFGRCEREFIFDQVNTALSPIVYANENEFDYVQSNIYKADVSSAYPYGLCFDLPDIHKGSVRKIAGVIPPNEEYPFAFYVNSGHLAIYKELDTYKEFRTHPLYSSRGKFRNEFYGDKDVTILCKRSKYSLKNVMMDLYDQKGEDPNIKTMMVAFIGYIRSTQSWQHHYMGHLSACVYARHIKRMLKFYDAIVKDGNIVEMIPTDAICWKGHAMPGITTKEKKIGNFVLEFENAKLLMLANGVYGIEVNKEIVCFKHQGTSSDELNVEIKKLTDILKLRSMGINAFDKRSGKFVVVDPILGSIKRDI